MSKKKKLDWSLVVFIVLCVVLVSLVFLLSRSLEDAEAERDRLVALEDEKKEELKKLETEARQLNDYTTKLRDDSEFVADESRERLGGAEEGEIVIRPEGR